MRISILKTILLIFLFSRDTFSSYLIFDNINYFILIQVLLYPSIIIVIEYRQIHHKYLFYTASTSDIVPSD